MLCTSSFPCSLHKALRRIILQQNCDLCNQRIPQETREMQTETLPFRPGFLTPPRRIVFLSAKWMLPFSPSPSGFPPPRRPSSNDSCIFLPSHCFPALPSSGRIAPPTRQASYLFRSEVRPASRIICRLHLRPIKLLIPSGLKSDRLFRSNGALISDLSIYFSVQVGSQTRLLTLKCM